MTKVINIKHNPNWKEEGVVYIGRGSTYREGSIYGNPFRITKQLSRNESIAKYRIYLKDKLKNDHGYEKILRQLKDKTLGCFCRPKVGFQGKLLCHGQIIAAYLDGVEPEDVE